MGDFGGKKMFQIIKDVWIGCCENVLEMFNERALDNVRVRGPHTLACLYAVNSIASSLDDS